MKAMSIIGIVWFSLSLLFVIIALVDYDPDISAAFGILGLLYALPLAITVLVKSSEKQKTKRNVIQELFTLNELKEKGILSEDEFQVRKNELLIMLE